MNKNCYRVVFSKRLNALVAVGENVVSAGKAASGTRAGKRLAALAIGGTTRLAMKSSTAMGAALLTVSSGMLLMPVMASAQTKPLAPVAVNALPTGGKVVAGSVATTVNGSTMTVNQSTNKAIVNWNGFDVGSNAKVNINQPGANAVILNRVVGNDPTQIHGQLNANGQVMIVNPNGIVVGKDGAVSASGFTASSYGISDADFLAGKHKFDRNGTTAGVRIDGKINTTSGGYVALIGAEVTNQGQITSPQGTVVMAAGESVTVAPEIAQNLSTSTDTDKKIGVPLSNRVRLTVSAASINTAVNNTAEGVIVTDGGQVLLQAAAVSDAVASVTHSGRIDASGEKGGTVTLQADSGRIKVNGSIKANSTDTKVAGGNIVIGRDDQTGKLSAKTDVSGAKLEAKGGFIETSGDYLKSEGVSVQAKTWLLDPVNVEINATNTAVVAGNSVVLASDINTALNLGTSVEVSTGVTTGTVSSATSPITTVVAGVQGDGHIYVNESIAKTAGGDATLTLIANRNIDVTAGKTITSTAGKLHVVFNANSGGNGGAIFFDSNSGITSNGGNITLGGGTGLNGSGFAVSDGNSSLQGILLNKAQIHAGGGNIVMNGQTSVTTWQDNVSNVVGLSIAGASAISTTGAGTITLTGKNQIGTMTRANAFELEAGSTITGGSTGAVTIVGDSSAANTGYSNIRGAYINGTVTSTGGNIFITGKGGAGAQYNNGVEIGGNVIAVGIAEISITGTGGAGDSGGHVGVSIVNPAKITSVDGRISINGTGGIGNGATIRDHGVSIDSTNAISSTGLGDITVTGKVVNDDNGFSQGIQINRGGLQTTTGNIKIDGSVFRDYQTAVWVNAPIKTTAGGNIYVRSSGANITNTTSGTLSANNISIDNSNGSIDPLTGAITSGSAGASTWSGVISKNGVDIQGSVTATNNVNVYGNQKGIDSGINVAGSTVMVTGKNVTLTGLSNSGNGVKFLNATMSGAYINAVGSTTSGYNGFAWDGGKISTTGTNGTQTTSTVKGISAASSTASNGYGALMLYGATATLSAIAGTTLTLEGQATTLATGLNTQERGILVQGGRTLNTNGNITLKGTSNNGEGIAFGGTINESGTDSKLTIIGEALASKNAGLNAVNISGTINGNTSTGPITIIGTAANSSGTNYDNAVNISGTINGGSASNVIVQATDGKIDISGKISGNEISVDNTNGVINTSTGAITAGTGVSKFDNAISISGSLTSNDNVNILGKVLTTTNTGVKLDSAASISTPGAGAAVNVYSNGSILNNASSIAATNGKVNLIADEKVTHGGSITSGNGTTILGKTGVVLNGNITNTTTGAIDVHAGNGSASSTATLIAGVNSTLTQNANGGVKLVTDGLGNLTPSKIINNGTGNIELSAGNLLAAGNGTGGQVVALNGNTSVNSSTGKLYVYSGAANVSGNLGYLTPDLSLLYYQGTTPLNTAFNQAYGATINGTTATSQVLFREAVSPAKFQVQLSDLTKVYGDLDPTLSASKLGLVSGQPTTLTSVVGGNTFALSKVDVASSLDVSNATRVAGENVVGGPYAYSGITTSLADVALKMSALNITAADLLVTGSQNAVTTYNGAVQTNSVTVAGKKFNDSFIVTGMASGRNASTTPYADNLAVAAGSGTLLSNYSIKTVDGSLLINKKDATVNGTNTALTYNGNQQTQAAAQTSGFISTDAITISGLAQGTNAGSYTSALNVGGADASNYNVTINNAALDISKASLIVSGNSSNVTYNGGNQSVSGFTVSGLKGSDTVATLTGISAAGATGRNAGAYDNLVTVVDQANYTVTGQKGVLTIGQKAATVTGSQTSTTYNGSVQTQTDATTSGFIAGDKITISGLASATNAGSYNSSLSVGGADAGNYIVTVKDATLDIAKAALAVLGNSSTVTYNAGNQSVSGFTVSGLKGSDTVATLTGISAAGATGRNAGTYDNLVTVVDQANYTVTGQKGVLTIGQKAATVNGTQTSTTYNGSVQTQTDATTSGFIAGDKITISGLASATNAGSYNSSLTVGGADAGNYIVTVKDATLDIAKAALSVLGNSSTVTYNGGNQSVSGFTVSGLKGSDTVATLTGISAAGATGRNAGTYDNLVTVVDQANYTVTGQKGVLTIGQKAATVNGTQTSTTYNGSVQTQTDATTSGFIAGDKITISGLASATNAGSYNSSLSVGGADAGNYIVTIKNATLDIAKAALTVLGNSSNVTYNAGNQNVSGFTVSGLKGSDTVATLTGISTAGATGRNAGAYDNLVTVADQANYTVTGQKGVLKIDPAALTVSGITATDKTYDGTTLATVSTQAVKLDGLFKGDDVKVTASGAFLTPDVGVAKPVQLKVLSEGTDSANYVFTYQKTASASINEVPAPAPQPRPEPVPEPQPAPSPNVKPTPTPVTETPTKINPNDLIAPTRPVVLSGSQAGGSVKMASNAPSGRAFSLASAEDDCLDNISVEEKQLRREAGTYDEALDRVELCYSPEVLDSAVGE